jgi:hypothetical protein
MRSCSISVLVDQTTEEIASVDLRRLIHAGECQSDGWFRRLQPERSVRTVGVVVLHVDPQHLLEVARTGMLVRITASSRTSLGTLVRYGTISTPHATCGFWRAGRVAGGAPVSRGVPEVHGADDQRV